MRRVLFFSPPIKTTENNMDSSYLDKLVDPENPNDLCPMPLSSKQRFKKVLACVLKGMPGFDKFEDSFFAGKFVRQMCEGQKDDEGNDVSGHFIIADVAAVFLFAEKNNATKWANNVNQVNVDIAPSLTYIESGHFSVSLLRVD